MLFLNKRDLFAEKITHADPVKWFPDYTGGCNYENAEAYFKKEFEKRVKKRPDGSLRDTYMYSTCATDTQNIQMTFDAVTQNLFAKVYDKIGF